MTVAAYEAKGKFVGPGVYRDVNGMDWRIGHDPKTGDTFTYSTGYGKLVELDISDRMLEEVADEYAANAIPPSVIGEPWMSHPPPNPANEKSNFWPIVAVVGGGGILVALMMSAKK